MERSGLLDALDSAAKRGVKINLFTDSLLNQLKYTIYAVLYMKKDKWKIK